MYFLKQKRNSICIPNLTKHIYIYIDLSRPSIYTMKYEIISLSPLSIFKSFSTTMYYYMF